MAVFCCWPIVGAAGVAPAMGRIGIQRRVKAMLKNRVYLRDQKSKRVNPLLVAMAERVGVDLASTESPAPLAAMQLNCAVCESHERCEDWTNSPDGNYDRNFCLNTDILDQIWMRTAILFDENRLRFAEFKTDIHPDRETRGSAKKD
jgi:Family of unknown function (DUF6455)